MHACVMCMLHACMCVLKCVCAAACAQMLIDLAAKECEPLEMGSKYAQSFRVQVRGGVRGGLCSAAGKWRKDVNTLQKKKKKSYTLEP